MEGKFYGVGVGPGDPELMTLKAAAVIRACHVIAVPVSDSALKEPQYEEAGAECRYPEYLEKCVAYQIALPVVPEMEKKARLYLPMPMMKEKEKLKQIHDLCAAAAAQQLKKGCDIAFITLGDPSVYSTCLYVHKRLVEKGCKTELIPGIPSFCAAAARLKMGLVENKDELHIIPASYEIEKGLQLPGTKVLMKAGKKMPYVKQCVKERGMQIKMVENCGMEAERLYDQVDDIPDQSSYYSLLIIKDAKGAEWRKDD